MGNLTRDPELSFLPSQTAVVNFGIALNERWKDTQSTSFFEVVAFGGLAETINKYFSKGMPILIEGRMKQDRWENSDGSNRQKVKIVAENFRFVDTKESSGNSSGNSEASENSDW